MGIRRPSGKRANTFRTSQNDRRSGRDKISMRINTSKDKKNISKFPVPLIKQEC